jgi:hypothetical protein
VYRHTGTGPPPAAQQTERRTMTIGDGASGMPAVEAAGGILRSGQL